MSHVNVKKGQPHNVSSFEISTEEIISWTTPQMVVDLAQKQKTLLLLGIFRDGHRRFLVVK